MPKKRKPTAPSDPDASIREAERLRRVARTCRYFSRGLSAAAIAKKLEVVHKTPVSRETPYLDLLHAVQIGYLEYKPPYVEHVGEQLKRFLPADNDLDLMVVETESRKDVAIAAATQVHREIESTVLDDKVPSLKLEEWLQKKESELPPAIPVPVHVGFSGGRTLSKAAERLGVLLRRDLESFDDTLRRAIESECRRKGLEAPSGDLLARFHVQFVFHNLVTGFDFENLETHPLAFLYDMAISNGLLDNGRCQFRCFNAAPFGPIDPVAYQAQFEVPGVREAVKNLKRIDLIVSSGGSFGDERSALNRFYGRRHMATAAESRRALAFLRKHECRGDFLGQPMTDEGPFDLVGEIAKLDSGPPPLDYRPVTAIDIHELPDRIRKGAKVILALGPSKNKKAETTRTQDRADIFQAILRQCPRMLTHAIVDLQTAREAIGWLERGRA